MNNNGEAIDCPRCGGYGGEPGSNFGDYRWHSCYFCLGTGVVTQEDIDRDEMKPIYQQGYDCYDE